MKELTGRIPSVSKLILKELWTRNHFYFFYFIRWLSIILFANMMSCYYFHHQNCLRSIRYLTAETILNRVSHLRSVLESQLSNRRIPTFIALHSLFVVHFNFSIFTSPISLAVLLNSSISVGVVVMKSGFFFNWEIPSSNPVRIHFI